MSQNQLIDEPAILYVDDESQALKYFKRSFDDRFKILTAESADEAEALVNKTNDIGIVISDQRMPGRTGASLLGALRQSHPSIVRIVTTAYSNVDSAVEAVNRGEVLRYIVKPWDIDALGLDLHTAMQVYKLQKERAALLADKLSVKQSITAVDRLRMLIVACSGLKGFKNAEWSVCRYGEDIGRLSAPPVETVPKALDLWGQNETETHFMRSIVTDLASFAEPQNAAKGTSQLEAAWTAASKNAEVVKANGSLNLPTAVKGVSVGMQEPWLSQVLQHAIEGIWPLVSNPSVNGKKTDTGNINLVIEGAKRLDAAPPIIYAQELNGTQVLSTELLKTYLMVGETSSSLRLDTEGEHMRLSLELSPLEEPKHQSARNYQDGLKRALRNFENWP